MATGHDLAEQLLRRAVDDEAAARAMLSLESVTDAIVGFHAQQAVEKSLKAVLAARETALSWATVAVAWARSQIRTSAEDAETSS
jgi:hypothetical protein